MNPSMNPSPNDLDARAVAIFKLRAEIHRRIRHDLQRVAELEAEVLWIDAELKRAVSCQLSQ